MICRSTKYDSLVLKEGARLLTEPAKQAPPSINDQRRSMMIKQHLTQYLRDLVKGVMAGFMISIAATIYLSISNPVMGALMFSIGLLIIVLLNYNLFTGMAGFFPQTSLFQLITAFIGNFIGCGIYGIIYKISTMQSSTPRANELINTKMQKPLLSLFLLGMLCGCLMFIAVYSVRKQQSIFSFAVLILCVSGFIIAGFEHSVADMAYLFLSENITIQAIFKILTIALGNFVGAFTTKLSVKE